MEREDQRQSGDGNNQNNMQLALYKCVIVWHCTELCLYILSFFQLLWLWLNVHFQLPCLKLKQ